MRRESDLEHLRSLFHRAVEKTGSVELPAKLVGPIADRIHSGRSFDCDEYRALLKLGQHEPASQISAATVNGWLRSGAIVETERGEENVYFRNQFDHCFFCKADEIAAFEEAQRIAF